MIVMTLMIVGLNITGIRPSGTYGLLERYMMAAVMSFLFIKRDKDREIFWLFTMGGVGIYLGALAGTNLGLKENAMYLEPAIVALVIYACEDIKKSDFPEKSSHMLLRQVGICCLLFEIIFTKAYFVCAESTKPANVFEKRVKSEVSVLENIWNYEELDKAKVKQTEYISENTDKNKSYAFIGKNPVCFLYFKGKLVQPQYNTTLSPEKQWVEYYKRKNAGLPDEIFVCKDKFDSIESFWITPLGEYIHDDYSVSDEEMFFRLVKE
ncbi:MAG: hypothetical protein K6G03_02950 [Lachnospiraceae bacterium]|nr:hypothetical protein [Lachnospiraceae bacterium]